MQSNLVVFENSDGTRTQYRFTPEEPYTDSYLADGEKVIKQYCTDEEALKLILAVPMITLIRANVAEETSIGEVRDAVLNLQNLRYLAQHYDRLEEFTDALALAYYEAEQESVMRVIIQTFFDELRR